MRTTLFKHAKGAGDLKFDQVLTLQAASLNATFAEEPGILICGS